MAEITKELGRIPVSRGNYQATTEYYKDNIVQYKRGSYQVISDSPIIGIPPTNDKNIVNPGWTLFAGTLDAQDVVNQVKDQETKSIQAVAAREAEILAKSDATKVSFNNTGTSLSGTNVQDALEETDDKINQLKNAGYLYAGIATPTTNPGTPEGPVFYIANGKGTYTNFGGIDITENEVVILYYDTIWHKNATWIASQEKLTELATKITEINVVRDETTEDEIIIKDNDGNVVAKIDTDGADFKNLKNNGLPVAKNIEEISHSEEVGSEEEQRWESNDGTKVYARINENGLSANVYIDVPKFSLPDVVEPSDSIIDDGYSSPIGRSNVKRENWSADNKYMYYEFIEHYYDVYLQNNAEYMVTKRSLGSDSSNAGYELFEYDFRPKKYSKVVMLSAGMNTCETGGEWGLATFMRAIMTSQESGFVFLRNNVRFKVIPVICPSSFDEDTLKYENHNGITINRNFDYKRNFYNVTWPTKGTYPDSEEETKILKRWMNDNAWRADLYIDCHQDPDAGEDKYNILSAVICSDSDTTNRINGCMPALVNYYKDKGIIPSSVTPKASAWTESGTVYPKTKYCKDVCGIRALMIEQYCASTMYGSDGTTINDTFQIKHYVAVLRLYIFAILAGNKTIKSLGELGNFIK